MMPFAEVRRAARRLRNAPTYSLAVGSSVAVGIGVVAAIFALVDAVLLRPLPYPAAERLVAIRHTAVVDLPENGLSAGTFTHYRDNNRVFDRMGVYVEHVMTLSDPGEPEQVRRTMLSPEILSMLGATPVVGRLPTDDDAKSGAPQSVFISYDLWNRRFGGDRAIVGRTLELGRRRYEIAGVMADGFHFPHAETQIWVTWPQKGRASGVNSLYMGGIARLRPGVSPDSAARDLQRLATLLPEVYGDVTTAELQTMGLRPLVLPLKEAFVGDVRVPLLLLLGTAVFLLLITWTNAVNLSLVRAEAQRRDVAVTLALGAPARAVVARFFAEALLLAAVGGALSLLLARGAIATRFGFQADQIPRLREVGTSGAVVALVAVLALITCALLAGVTITRVLRSRAEGMLSGGSRATSGRSEQTGRRFLVAGQVALTLTLLIGSGLMARSFWRMSRVDLGFRAGPALTLQVPLPPSAYGSYHATARLHQEFLDKVRQLPGVQSAEAVSRGAFPLTPVPSFWNERIAAVDRTPIVTGTWPSSIFSFATPRYFATMGIPLLRGRTFGPNDMNREAPGVIVSTSLARALFAGDDPVGRRIRWADQKGYPDYTVVGEVGDVPSQTLREGMSRALYFPNVFPPAADSVTGVVLTYIPDEEVYVVRTALPAATLLPAVRRIVRDLDPKLVVGEVATLDEVVAASRAQVRLTLVLLLIGAATALFLGMLGIYGVLAYAVRQRTAELGVRIALGATPGVVARMVVRQGVLLAAAGLAVGLVASVLLTRFLGTMLYEVSPTDPLVFIAMALLLMGAALTASYLPARRAGRIDPVRAIKGD
jgi:predicted permease